MKEQLKRNLLDFMGRHHKDATYDSFFTLCIYYVAGYAPEMGVNEAVDLVSELRKGWFENERIA